MKRVVTYLKRRLFKWLRDFHIQSVHIGEFCWFSRVIFPLMHCMQTAVMGAIKYFRESFSPFFISFSYDNHKIYV